MDYRRRRALMTVMGRGTAPEGILLTKNLPAALSNFNTQMAGGAHGIMYVFGDSIGAGQNATTPLVNGWVYKVADYLQTKYGIGTLTFPGDAGWVEAGTGWGASWYPGTFYIAGTTATQGRMSATENDTKTFTATGSRFDLYYHRQGALGIFKISVDGGAEEDIDAVASIVGEKVRTFNLSSASHTFVIRVAAGQRCFITGMQVSDGAGVTLYNHSIPGTKINTAYTDEPRATGIPVLPNDMPVLFCLSLTTNDYGIYGNQVALSSFTSDTTAMINYLKQYGDVLLIAENWRAQELAVPQESYDDVYQSLAVGNVGCIRIAKKWGKAAAAIASGYVTDLDGVHPNNIGHADYDSLVTQFL